MRRAGLAQQGKPGQGETGNCPMLVRTDSGRWGSTCVPPTVLLAGEKGSTSLQREWLLRVLWAGPPLLGRTVAVLGTLAVLGTADCPRRSSRTQ